MTSEDSLFKMSKLDSVIDKKCFSSSTSGKSEDATLKDVEITLNKSTVCEKSLVFAAGFKTKIY